MKIEIERNMLKRVDCTLLHILQQGKALGGKKIKLKQRKGVVHIIYEFNNHEKGMIFKSIAENALSEQVRRFNTSMPDKPVECNEEAPTKKEQPPVDLFKDFPKGNNEKRENNIIHAMTKFYLPYNAFNIVKCSYTFNDRFGNRDCRRGYAVKLDEMRGKGGYQLWAVVKPEFRA